MSRNYLIVPDSHAHPDFPNDRADWLGQLIKDRKPDVVVNIGDTFDMPSLSSFDKGKASFYGNSYERDIEAGVEFLDRVWSPVKKSKKKRPKSIYLVGNHDLPRLRKVLEYQPELGGSKFGIGEGDFQLDKYHHEVVDYVGGTPGIYQSDGISFAHYMVSELMGRPIGGENHAASLLNKNYSSCVVGHSHAADWSVRTGSNGKKIMGLVCGVYQDYSNPWAGNVANMWHRGVVFLNNVEDGVYDPEWISLGRLRNAYGNK